MDEYKALGPPVPAASQEELQGHLRTLVAHAGKMAPDSPDLREFLGSEKFSLLMATALRNIITHSGKVPAAHRQESAYVPALLGRVKLPYACGLTCDLRRPTAFQGPVGAIRFAKILTTQFERVVGGKTHSLIGELLADVRGDLCFALVLLGLPMATIDGWAKYLKNKPALPDEAGDVVLRMPTADGYRALSPVASAGMCVEIFKRGIPLLGFRRSIGMYAVGGANPVNAGDFVVAMGGKVRYISSGVFRKKKPDTILRSVIRWRTVLALGDFEPLATEKILREINFTANDTPWFKFKAEIEKVAQICVRESYTKGHAGWLSMSEFDRTTLRRYLAVYEIRFLERDNMSPADRGALASILSNRSVRAIERAREDMELFIPSEKYEPLRLLMRVAWEMQIEKEMR